MTKKTIVIHWFRQDLRISDNPALADAIKTGIDIIPIYILDNKNAGNHALGAASCFWLHYSLKALNISLGNRLSVYKDNPENVLQHIIESFQVEGVYWNECYEPWRVERDTHIKKYLQIQKVKVYTFNGSLLWNPNEIKKADATPYKVFTPFYIKGCLNATKPRIPLSEPKYAKYVLDKDHIGIDSLHLLSELPLDADLRRYWNIGELSAQKQLKNFVKNGLPFYKDGRNLPIEPYVSRLSPYLHFGETSPNQIWYAVRNTTYNEHVDHFCSELGWREFSYNQLYHNPDLPIRNLQSKFDSFPWESNLDHLLAWKSGKTGIPLVDAGMRELLNTGYMHNRVRMVVGSFLVKNLRLHWHHGEEWFWKTLVDADLANNSASWQWIAGCGSDSAPYFRIFNPVTQGKKFDPDGKYIRKYIPEIAMLPNKYLFSPWEAPKIVLQTARISMDSVYLNPIINLKESREAALVAFKSLKYL